MSEVGYNRNYKLYRSIDILSDFVLKYTHLHTNSYMLNCIKISLVVCMFLFDFAKCRQVLFMFVAVLKIKE